MADLAPVELVPLDQLDDRYQQFLDVADGALLYYDIAYGRVVAGLLGCRAQYLIARRDGVVVGALPVMEQEGRWGRVLNSLPFYGSHGGALAVDDDATRALYEAWNDLTSAPDVAAATIVLNPLLPDALPRQVARFDLTDGRTGGLTPLDAAATTREAVLAGLAGDARYDVRRALASGVEVSVENDAFDELHATHVENMLAVGGTPKDRRFFKLLEDEMVADRDYRIWVGRVEGRFVAGLLVLYAHSTVEYFTPATDAEFRSAQPSALLLADAMADAAARGCTRWNWGGSWASQTGVLRFKRKWGSVDHPYTYLTRVNEQALLHQTPEDLLAAYPSFFVVPFAALA